MIYAPAKGERQEWEFDPDDLYSYEAEALEDVGDDKWSTYVQWADAIRAGNMRAWRGALWTMLKRGNPDLGFDDVVFRNSELLLADDDEAAETESEGKEEGGDSPTDST